MKRRKPFIDRDLWETACSGNKEAIEELIQRFDPIIKAESKVNGKLDEEVAQEIREKLYREIQKISNLQYYI